MRFGTAVVQGKAFKGRQFTGGVILWASPWYLMFPAIYRGLELMLEDRGVNVDHTQFTGGSRLMLPNLRRVSGRT
jgi:IS6 family transposase